MIPCSPKPYTDEELRRTFPWPREYTRHYTASMAGDSHHVNPATAESRIRWLDRATHRLLATVAEDHRRLAIATAALEEVNDRSTDPWAIRHTSEALAKISSRPTAG